MSKISDNMNDRLTKRMSRNIYIGGTLFSILLLTGLTVDTVRQTPKRENRAELTEAVAKGKQLWEKNNCVGCHTILGEGAYYAPELGNVFQRRGNSDKATFKAYLSGWMAAQPLQEAGRRKMPQFNLTDKEVDEMAEFLIWTSKIDTNNWPPNIEG
jgi:nitric oxide reductase subunit C